MLSKCLKQFEVTNSHEQSRQSTAVTWAVTSSHVTNGHEVEITVVSLSATGLFLPVRWSSWHVKIKFLFHVKMVLLRRSGLFNKRSLLFLRSRNHSKNGNIHSNANPTESTEQIEEIKLSDGKTISLLTGKYARFTSGNVIAKCGETSVMTTAVRKNEPVHGHIIPLTVDYRQKAAAIGRIPSNYFRRELGHTEHEILASRLIDRSVRPLFHKKYCYETQVVCNLLAVDGVNDPEVLSINAVSAALSVSDIPWNGPVGAVRIGMIDNQIVINPSRRDLQHSDLDLIVTCTSKSCVIMIEGSANDVSEPDLRKAIRMAVKECQLIVSSITQLRDRIGKPKTQIPEQNIKDMSGPVREFSEREIRKVFTCYTHDKISRDNAINDLRMRLLERFKEDNPEAVKTAFDTLVKKTFRSLIFETHKRCDGREFGDLRDIKCQVGLFKPLHGSAFFQRGQTQVMCTVTLDSIENALRMDSITSLISGIKDKNFFLHYDFPPYATNEIGKVTGTNRREIGHGALAEKGLRAVIPKNYPFSIRLTSEVLESNGSSSMASVCGGSMALMDAGVPISAQVAGVAIGLVSNFDDSNSKQTDQYHILTDILGIEDYLGDMDFKAAGSKKGFTSVQLDVKVPGLPTKVVMESIQKATMAKQKILQIMNAVIMSPRECKADNQPLYETIEVPVHQRAKFLGVGGYNMKKIFAETGVNINSQGENMYSLFAPNKNAMTEAKEMIDQILTKESEPELTFGDIYTAKITEVRDIGLMITLYPTMNPTLLPNSQLDRRRVHHPSVLGFQVGHEIQVKYFGRDPVSGQIRLSRKVLQEPVSEMRNLGIVAGKD
ncbi:polyribonucleotide nucleotidyltransferase 1 [Lasioglossum baleicum]|uniref:polyribonucleotide nucleotidyltransferase 1 n=1 Tax=Lasioglossum baleicum TaxID=434251 RepID=UPI003FCD8D1E